MTELQETIKNLDWDSIRGKSKHDPREFVNLLSVGTGVESTYFAVHTSYRSGGYDLQNYTDLEDCTDEWYSSLSRNDECKILLLILKTFQV